MWRSDYKSGRQTDSSASRQRPGETIDMSARIPAAHHGNGNDTRVHLFQGFSAEESQTQNFQPHAVGPRVRPPARPRGPGKDTPFVRLTQKSVQNSALPAEGKVSANVVHPASGMKQESAQKVVLSRECSSSGSVDETRMYSAYEGMVHPVTKDETEALRTKSAISWKARKHWAKCPSVTVRRPEVCSSCSTDETPTMWMPAIEVRSPGVRGETIPSEAISKRPSGLMDGTFQVNVHPGLRMKRNHRPSRSIWKQGWNTYYSSSGIRMKLHDEIRPSGMKDGTSCVRDANAVVGSPGVKGETRRNTQGSSVSRMKRSSGSEDETRGPSLEFSPSGITDGTS